MPHADLKDAWCRLADRFADRLMDLRPERVLDVGCGGGRLLGRLRDEGVDAVGVEVAEERVEGLRERGFEAVAAAAEELPFADASFDWVTMRHVPHHLPDVPAAFAEAARVSRHGLLVSEPHFDVRLPGQATALRWDLWMKRRHEAMGTLHRPVLTAAELLAALPDRRHRWTIETFHPFVAVTAHLVREDAEPLLAGLAADAPERRELDELLRDVDAQGMSYNGTLILRVDWGSCASTGDEPDLV